MGYLTMSSLEHLDAVLGEALEFLMEASNEVRGVNIINQKDLLRKLGRTVSELWSIREEIYRIEPSLKRDFIVEHEQDKQRYEELSDLQIKAYNAEKEGDVDAATNFYQELLTISRFGYFRLLSEAALYRLSKTSTDS